MGLQPVWIVLVIISAHLPLATVDNTELDRPPIVRPHMECCIGRAVSEPATAYSDRHGGVQFLLDVLWDLEVMS
jgi:hypothetical protein